MSGGRDFTLLNFDEIEAGLVDQFRQLQPDFTETDRSDAVYGFARMAAFLGERDARIMDGIASSRAWPSVMRRSEAIALATVVGERLLADAPAGGQVFFDLTSAPGSSDVLIPALAIFRTRGDDENPASRFENIDGDFIAGALTVLGVLDVAAGTTVGNPLSGLSAVTPVVGDAWYWGHRKLMGTAFSRALTGAPDDYSTRFEYHDGFFRVVQPDAGTVAAAGAGITMRVDGLLGVSSDCSGLVVTVRQKVTGQSESVTLTYAGGHNVLTTGGKLGQGTVSTRVADYEVSARWLPFNDVVFTATGVPVTTAIAPMAFESDELTPNNDARRWTLFDLEGVEGYWIRERVVAVGGSGLTPTGVSTVVGVTNVWTGEVDVVQGQSIFDLLGTALGDAFERFALSSGPFIEGSVSRVSVGLYDDWEEVRSFAASEATDRHFRMVEEPDGSRYIVFGDGLTGSRLTAGSDVYADYRTGADTNGNVTAGAIRTSETTTQFVTNVRNVRRSTGWQRRQGGTAESVLALQHTIPGLARARGRLVTNDNMRLVPLQEFFTADGRQPFARLLVVPQGAGYKTGLVVAVGTGGEVPTADDMAELGVWFNGVRVGYQRFGGRMLFNQEAVVVAYDPVVLTLAVTVQVHRRHAQTAKADAEAALAVGVHPLAMHPDGAWRWLPGIDVTDTAIKALLGSAGPDRSGLKGLVDATIATPSLPISLGATNLPAPPTPGSITVTVQEIG